MANFLVGNCYKHARSMDVFIRVHRLLPNNTALVTWYNFGFEGRPWPVFGPQVIDANATNWQKLSASDWQTPRSTEPTNV